MLLKKKCAEGTGRWMSGPTIQKARAVGRPDPPCHLLCWIFRAAWDAGLLTLIPSSSMALKKMRNFQSFCYLVGAQTPWSLLLFDLYRLGKRFREVKEFTEGRPADKWQRHPWNQDCWLQIKAPFSLPLHNNVGQNPVNICLNMRGKTRAGRGGLKECWGQHHTWKRSAQSILRGSINTSWWK